MNIVDKGPQKDLFGDYIGNLYVVDGIDIYVCYPQNGELTGNVETTFFWPGSGSNSSYRNGSLVYVKNFINNSDNNLLVSVDYKRSIYSSDSKTEDAIEAVNKLMKYISDEKNINISYAGVDCCSAGGVPSTKQLLSLLKNDNQSGIKEYGMSLNLYDAYTHDENYFQYSFTPEELEALKENNTQVTFFVRNDTEKNYKRINKITNPDGQDGAFVRDLVGAGIYPVLIYGNYIHNEILIRVKEDGWLDYQNGLIGLEDIKNTKNINYRINLYEDGKWVEYLLSEIVDARKHPELYGERSVALINAGNYLDSTYVNVNFEYLKEIDSLNSICKTNISKTIIDSNSSSILLPEENEIMYQINDAIVRIQNLFSCEINKIKDAGKEYLLLEEKLAASAKQLNSFLYNDPIINNKNNLNE